MKKFLLILLVTTSSIIQAQAPEEASTITTFHTEYYPMTVEEYRSKIDLTITDNGYGVPCYASVEEMQDAFYKKVKELGLNTNNISKDEMEFYRTGYNRKGMTYIYTTKSQDDIKTFMKVKMPNGYPRAIEYKLVEPSVNLKEISKKGLAKTRSQAEAIAQSLGKKVIKARDINASQSRYNRKWTTYQEEGYLSLNVVYIIE